MVFCILKRNNRSQPDKGSHSFPELAMDSHAQQELSGALRVSDVNDFLLACLSKDPIDDCRLIIFD